MRIEVAGETNVGRKRNHNEDNFALMPEFGLYMVADGMGGHASGEVASKLSIDTMHKFLTETSDDPERTWPYKMDRSKGYEENRLITSPAYMLAGSISEAATGIERTVAELMRMAG